MCEVGVCGETRGQGGGVGVVYQCGYGVSETLSQ
jgi:hypothetical protein